MDINSLAKKIADDIFQTDSEAHRVNRLVMEFEEHLSGPGWCREALNSRILRHLMRAAEQKPRVLQDVENERYRQDKKWGGPDHDDEHMPSDWYQTIRAYLEWAFMMARMDNPEKYRRRMIQVAALAIAAVESHDRLIIR